MTIKIDREKAELAVKNLIEALGLENYSEGIKTAPVKITEMLTNIFSSVDTEPEFNFLVDKNSGEKSSILIVKNLKFKSMCEHHFLPMKGVVHIGYIPNKFGKIATLGSIRRTVESFSKRPQVQERLTEQIAEYLDAKLAPKGVIVVIQAEHLCISMLGGDDNTEIKTFASRGCMEQLDMKDLFFDMLRN